MSKIHIRQVEAFRAVVRLRSMTKAAEYLGISQPAVSRLISDFQATTGFKLFDRRQSSAEPTPDALLLFEQVEKLFYGLEEIDRQIEAINNLQIGNLTISATNSYSDGFLPHLISEFKKKHANVTVELDIQPHEQVLDWVASGRSEVGFAIQPVAKSDLTTEVIASGYAHCIFPKSHPFEDKEILHPSDFEGMPYVSFQRGQALRFMIDGFFDREGVDRILDVETTSFQVVCSLVAAGLGVALVNPFSPIDAHAAPLESRPVKPSIAVDIQIIFNERQISNTSMRFIEFVKAEAPALLSL